MTQSARGRRAKSAWRFGLLRPRSADARHPARLRAVRRAPCPPYHLRQGVRSVALMRSSYWIKLALALCAAASAAAHAGELRVGGGKVSVTPQASEFPYLPSDAPSL